MVISDFFLVTAECVQKITRFSRGICRQEIDSNDSLDPYNEVANKQINKRNITRLRNARKICGAAS